MTKSSLCFSDWIVIYLVSEKNFLMLKYLSKLEKIMSVTSQNLSSKQILDAVKVMPNKEFEKLFEKVLSIRANAKNSNLTEPELLKKIYRKFSAEKLSQIKFLKNKLNSAELSETEYQDLANLSELLEEFHAQRMKNLVKLSKLRKLSLEETMKQLGIKFPDYD